MSYRSALLLLALSAAAAAQEGPPPEPLGIAGQNQPNAAGVGQAFADPSQIFSGREGAFVGFGYTRIAGEGSYMSTVINTEFSLGPVGLGLSLPSNFLVQPEAGIRREDITYRGVIRKRDWDEPQSFARLIRFVRYGHKRDPVYFLAGQLWGATLGHGTLINRYANNLSLDHPKLGLALDLNGTYFGIETLTDYVGNPTLVGTRAYVRPFGEAPFLRGWAVGVSFVSDLVAPRALTFNPDGTLKQDDKGNPVIAASQAIYAGGVDTEFEFLRNSLISVIPYVDLNRVAGAGNGLHTGVLTDLYLPIPVLQINVQARLEYRMMQPGYIPEYFDQTYDLGRIQYAVQRTPPGCLGGPLGCSPITSYEPKYVAAQDAHNAALDPNSIDRKGYYGELAFGFAGVLQIGGLYQDYQGDPNGASLGLFATLPKFELLKVSAYYLRKNMKSGFDDAFKLDERSLLAASLAYKMFGPIYMRVDFQRRWALQPGATHIQAVDTFQAGIATFISF